jgi:DNA-binding HxlR family transcriptional regulator
METNTVRPPEEKGQLGFDKDDSSHSREACTRSLGAVQDALYVLGGKWKLPIIIALQEGPSRFRDLQRLVEGITPKLLSKELKELEMNQFVVRNVYPSVPVLIEYALTEYSKSVGPIVNALREWGMQHRERVMAAGD